MTKPLRETMPFTTSIIDDFRANAAGQHWIIVGKAVDADVCRSGHVQNPFTLLDVEGVIDAPERFIAAERHHHVEESG